MSKSYNMYRPRDIYTILFGFEAKWIRSPDDTLLTRTIKVPMRSIPVRGHHSLVFTNFCSLTIAL
jgi:hypothetical protein